MPQSGGTGEADHEGSEPGERDVEKHVLGKTNDLGDTASRAAVAEIPLLLPAGRPGSLRVSI